MARKLETAIALAIVMPIVGCGGSDTTVKGSVTFNGKPVQNGSISFRPVDGRGPSFGAMIENGNYKVEKNARSGEKRAFISWIDESKMAHSRAEADQMIADAKAKGISVEEATNVELIPPDAEGNNQIVKIERGANTINFKLSSGGP